MSKLQIREIPQLELVFKAITRAKLDDEVWQVLDGFPVSYQSLQTDYESTKEMQAKVLYV